jgi:hypothetical protein
MAIHLHLFFYPLITLHGIIHSSSLQPHQLPPKKPIHEYYCQYCSPTQHKKTHETTGTVIMFLWSLYQVVAFVVAVAVAVAVVVAVTMVAVVIGSGKGGGG